LNTTVLKNTQNDVDGQSPKTPVITRVIHHRQNTSESTDFFVMDTREIANIRRSKDVDAGRMKEWGDDSASSSFERTRSTKGGSMELTRWRPKYRQELQPDHDGRGGVPTWAQTLYCRFGGKVTTPS
jgi:hypothetical protein